MFDSFFEECMFKTALFFTTILLGCMAIVSLFGTAAICCKIYQEINRPAISAEAE